jgi:myo-inositol-1(or 4)-monophosphatase
VSLDRFTEAALAACREVESYIRNNSDDRAYLLHSRGAGGDISIGFDLEAEAIFVYHLAPFGTISSEESGIIGEGGDLIVIDPIDGSDNLKTRFPYYGASVALQKENKTVAGIICNFANGDCFVKDEKRHYRTSLFNTSLTEPVTPHAHAKVGLFERAVLYPKEAQALIKAGLKFRSPGAVALSLAYAHYANYVVFFGTMRPYDLEAGLYMTDDLYSYRDESCLIIAKERKIFDQVCSIFHIPKESS